MKHVDFTRPPFRGILSEIARENGTTRQAVQKSASRGNPDVLAQVAAKARARQAAPASGPEPRPGDIKNG
ncbi:MAG TPA: hypothetical protein VHI13_01260 [Candidatus Kapabacteria bacterium]|nr:hypothetical protein [Candidatus Kapabacteria bacterium]